MPSLSRSPQTIEVFAPAKVNLALHVTGQRDDGYHLLHSLVMFADVGDRLWLTSGPDLSMNVSGPFAEGVPADGRNLAWQAAELCGWTGHIALEKNLPHGAGIGGGSSDAAAVLRGLGAKEDGLSLGADVPVCAYGKTAVMSGIGDTVQPVHWRPSSLPAVLVNPLHAVPTAPVFKALHQKENAPLAPLPDEHAADNAFWAWLAGQRNDLSAPAQQAAPIVADVISALTDCHTPARLVRMSGSGATCFGLYDDDARARAAARAIAADHPDWWVRSCRLGG